MEHDDNLRIDKWLWAVRIFKTRSQAAEACKKGRVLIDEVQVKPSRTVHVGEIVFVKKPPVTYQYKVLGLLGQRKSAKIVADYVEDVTPEEEKVKLEMKNYAGFEFRQKGFGRPTKRERRLIDKLKRKY
ncbi:MAG: S4 domain-containing protein [Bacteroidales bacterium]|jgi:ribosome-associated heat shock protein Hsp15|nr:S4 domain-containing protein [Bacteroidales bacterium]